MIGSLIKPMEDQQPARERGDCRSRLFNQYFILRPKSRIYNVEPSTMHIGAN
jgi:hypothetical protein